MIIFNYTSQISRFVSNMQLEKFKCISNKTNDGTYNRII